MSRLKPLIPFLLLGLIYPATLFGWAREALLETALGPILVLWAFSFGLGIMATMSVGGSWRGLPLLLGAGYVVGGLLWRDGPPKPLGYGVGFAIAMAVVLLGGVWGRAVLSRRAIPVVT